MWARLWFPAKTSYSCLALSLSVHSVGGALPSARTFDLSVRPKADPDHPIVFSALNKEELQNIEDFLHTKKIKVKNEMDDMAAVEAAVLGAAGDSDDDDDDDDMDVDDKPKASLRDTIGGDGEDEDSEGKVSFARACVISSFVWLTFDFYFISLPRAVDEDFQASSSDGGSDSDDSGDEDGSADGKGGGGGSDAEMSDASAKKPAKKKQKTS